MNLEQIRVLLGLDLTAWWRAYITVALMCGLRPGELQRHSFVSVLSNAGVDIEEIAEAVGHINSAVTKAVYRHQIADEITSAATAMDAIFGDASGS